jgi:hypothetical protein
VARGRGALDVAIGGALARLSEGDRVLQLGYSGIGDYARERLGMAGRTAQAMVRLAVELRTRPLLSEAVRRGEVSARKAQAVLPMARGQDEEQWVTRAHHLDAELRGLRCRAAAGRRCTLTTSFTARGAVLTRSQTWWASQLGFVEGVDEDGEAEPRLPWPSRVREAIRHRG